MDFIGIIPARYRSKRFPGKPLAQILGKSMIWHVFNASSKFPWKELVVATDDDLIEEHCKENNMRCVRTSPDHADCIDRAAEAALILQEDGIVADRYVIIQGDEPMFDTSVLDTDLSPEIVNLYTEVVKPEEMDDPNAVKVVVSQDLKAIYFSRYCIPYHHDATKKGSYPVRVDKQIGVYSMSIDALKQFSDLGMSYLEGVEGIGMLRFIENGIDVDMRYAQYDSCSVDNEEDLRRVEKLMADAEQ